jgi:hypothetical protein
MMHSREMGVLLGVWLVEVINIPVLRVCSPPKKD